VNQSLPTAEDNAALIEQFFEAFAAGDSDRLESLMAPGVTWATPGRNVLAATRTGPAEVIAQLNRSAELTQGTYRAKAHDLLASQKGAVVHYTGSGTRQGQAFSFEGLLHFTVADGRITRARFAPLDPEEFDRIWS
jgi:ketosteroid isomerase-like protein